MSNTTISIDTKTRDKLIEFKMPGETFNDLLLRLYESASQRQLQDLLMDSSSSLSVDEAVEWINQQ